MIKKLAGLVGAGALVLALAGPALAGNVAIIKGNDADATASTGGNTLVGNDVNVKKAGVDGNISVSGNNTLTTGKAKARAQLVIVANSDGSDDLAVVKWNDASADAATGDNVLLGNDVSVKKAGVDGNISVSGNNTLTTGNAKAKAKVWIVVNSNWSP